MGHPGAAAVEPAVSRPGALRVDAERLATTKDLERESPGWLIAALLSSRSTGSIPSPRTRHGREPFTPVPVK